MDVYRAGGITIANAPGTGISDDKAIYSFMPEIVEFYRMSGDVDYLLRVVVPDMQSLERFIVDYLAKIPGVSNIRSSFALKQVKYKTALPLPAKVPQPMRALGSSTASQAAIQQQAAIGQLGQRIKKRQFVDFLFGRLALGVVLKRIDVMCDFTILIPHGGHGAQVRVDFTIFAPVPDLAPPDTFGVG